MKQGYLKLLTAYIILIAIMFFLIGYTIGYNETKEVIAYNIPFTTLEAPNLSFYCDNITLANIVEEVDGELDLTTYKKVDKIIQCESSWNYKAQNKKSSAYGLGQFTNGTWLYVQKKWGIELDRNNYEDQLYAMVRLLEEEGSKHWTASQSCWEEN